MQDALSRFILDTTDIRPDLNTVTKIIPRYQ
jgi:hypothetical protein